MISNEFHYFFMYLRERNAGRQLTSDIFRLIIFRPLPKGRQQNSYAPFCGIAPVEWHNQ